MKALVYTGPHKLEMHDADEPVAGDGQCIVNVEYCGICGSDMHAYHGLDERRVPPLVLGHEVVGIVRNGRFAGKRVAINPLVTCGNCPSCQTERDNLCPDRELIGMRVPGGFAEAVAINEKNLTVLPDELSFRDAVVVEPLACAVHAISQGLGRLHRPVKEARAVVLGGGAIGLLSAFVMAHRGVPHIAIAETSSVRAQLLEKTIDAQIYNPAVVLPAAGNADIVVDAVGAGATRRAAGEIVVPGGVIVHVGLQNNDPGLDTRHLTLQEVIFLGSYCYTIDDFATAFDMLRTDAVTAVGWSQIRPLNDGPAAFVDIHEGCAPPKIILACSAHN